MGSGIIYYDIEKHEKYEGSADSDLAVVKTRRYHFDDEPFIHPPQSIRFDPDRLYELPMLRPFEEERSHSARTRSVKKSKSYTRVLSSWSLNQTWISLVAYKDGSS
ncbi:hypothetical protein PIB30_074188 [Stylosanthes scabra]|uniref:Uncharacterized protein n=1 Tax=Stylosanthes scabra TaxID=79078 RepID=A0ABU6UNC7_9FABA|nr:hypothetical protein [Stylosanthes scabra]